MINVFDLSAGIAGTMMLTEKNYRDGSPLARTRNDAAANKVPDLVEPPLEDKPVTHEPRSSSCKRYNGTPMKELIEAEMSKEIDAKQKPPSVVARLMGLEALPAQQQSATASQRAMQLGLLNRTLASSERIEDQYPRENASLEKAMRREIRPFGYDKDVYEASRQPSMSAHFKDEPFLRGRYRESPNDRRMALVRQKFIEAKQLATNKKPLQLKEFQDALEVLSSNRDLFLKFLEEPNSLFSKYLQEVQTPSSPTTRTRQITVLKPSRTSSDKGLERRTESCVPILEANGLESNMNGWGSTFLRHKTGNVPHPTRIVVLKPSPGEALIPQALVASSPTTLPKAPQSGELFEDFDPDVARGSREAVKEIARQMRESYSSRRDETLLSSSVLSNGYIGDESSIYRSDDENMEDERGNFSDSDVATPTSRHSWDDINRVGSPYSLSSFSGVSYSPELSVAMEAKKRLSERWVMLTSNEASCDQRPAHRSTSTLGEMLALTESKKEEEQVCTLSSFFRAAASDGGGAQDLNSVAASPPSAHKHSDEHGEETTPGSLPRSKSVPASCPDVVQSHLVVSLRKTKSNAVLGDKKAGKSSLKGKLSSLFSRSKKLSFHKPIPSSKDEHNDDSGPIVVHDSSHDLDGEPYIVTLKATDQAGLKDETPVKLVLTTVEKPKISENAGDPLGQPSPVSVLESPFGDHIDSIALQPCQTTLTDPQRAISRSPPIESVARSLSFNGGPTKNKIGFSPSDPSVEFLRNDIEECELTAFVQMLLSSSGLSNETPHTVVARWHSSESPLNPMLLDSFMERKDEEATHRKKRSNQRFLFDCVNSILSEISWNKEMDKCIYSTCCLRAPDDVSSSNSLVDEVLKRLKECFSSADMMEFGCVENGSQLVNSIMKKELDGSSWVQMVGLEISETGREIEWEVMEDLVGETLQEFLAGWVQ